MSSLEQQPEFQAPLLPFPNSFNEFLHAFIIAPIVILVYNLWKDKVAMMLFVSLKDKLMFKWIALSVMFPILFDIMGVSTGAWTFNESKSITSSIIPIEEVGFIIGCVLLCFCWTLKIFTILIKELESGIVIISPTDNKHVYFLFKYLMYGLYSTIFISGCYMFHCYWSKNDQTLFVASVICLTFPLFLIWQWWLGCDKFIRFPSYWLYSWLAPGVYLYIIERVGDIQQIFKTNDIYSLNSSNTGGTTMIHVEYFFLFIFSANLCSGMFWPQLVESVGPATHLRK